MKHLLKTSLLFLFLLALITSCKKENEGISIPKLKSIITLYDTTHYEYDAKGRLHRMVSTGRTSVFNYGPDVVVEDIYDASGALMFTNRYELNAQGLRQVYRRTFPESNVIYYYTYNSSAQVTTIATHVDGQPELASLYYYSNGLLDSIRTISEGGWLRDVQRMKYYTDIKSTITLENQGLYFMGTGNTAPSKEQEVIVYDANGAITSTVELDYTYEIDAKGRISRRLANTNGSPSNDFRYIYY